jgi:hypothetical protein
MDDEDSFLDVVAPETLTRPPYHRVAGGQRRVLQLDMGESSTDGDDAADDEAAHAAGGEPDRQLRVSRTDNARPRFDHAFDSPKPGRDDPVNERSPVIEAHEDLRGGRVRPPNGPVHLGDGPRRSISPFPPENLTPEEFVQQLTHGIANSPIASIGVRARTLTFSGSTPTDDDSEDYGDEEMEEDDEELFQDEPEDEFVPVPKLTVVRSQDGGRKMLLGSQEDLHQSTESDTDGPVVPSTPTPAPTMRHDADVLLAGRSGHAVFINGSYMRIPLRVHDNRPVFRHIDPIPPGFAEASGLP